MTPATRPPATLYIYTWCDSPVFMRLKIRPGPRPGCPLLHDGIWEIPVVEKGPAPLGVRPRQVPLFSDFLSDLFDDQVADPDSHDGRRSLTEPLAPSTHNRAYHPNKERRP